MTPETRAELLRLHAEFTAEEAAREGSALGPDDNEWHRRIEIEDEAHGRLCDQLIAHLLPLLDALAAAEAEAKRLREAVEAMLEQGDFSPPHWAGDLARAALSAPRGAAGGTWVLDVFKPLPPEEAEALSEVLP